MENEANRPLKLIAALVLDYLRWTQITPLIMVWLFGIVMLAAMFFVHNPEASWELIGSVFQWISELPLSGAVFARSMESLAGEDGTINLSGSEPKAMGLKVWGSLSLGFMLISLVVGWLFGPFKPWPLAQTRHRRSGLSGHPRGLYRSLLWRPQDVQRPNRKLDAHVFRSLCRAVCHQRLVFIHRSSSRSFSAKSGRRESVNR